jgi:hypothetical protein
MEVDAHDIGNKLVTSIICDYGVEKTTQQWHNTYLKIHLSILFGTNFKLEFILIGMDLKHIYPKPTLMLPLSLELVKGCMQKKKKNLEGGTLIGPSSFVSKHSVVPKIEVQRCYLLATPFII